MTLSLLSLAALPASSVLKGQHLNHRRLNYDTFSSQYLPFKTTEVLQKLLNGLLCQSLHISTSCGGGGHASVDMAYKSFVVEKWDLKEKNYIYIYYFYGET